MVWIVGIGIVFLLLIVFPKPIAGVAIVAGIAIVGFIFWDAIRDYWRAEERKSVQISVVQDLDRCSLATPLHITIENGTGRTIQKMRFSVEGRRMNHSDPLFQSGYQDYTSDRIIDAGETWAGCWKIPQKARNVSGAGSSNAENSDISWSAKSDWVDFLD